ncbi:MAG: hypothetical protein K8U57_23215 [Planctomycetes bacterium]|nr:hypothetical protein [Planctomycetota bacterium]
MNPATVPEGVSKPIAFDTFRARVMFLLALVFLVFVGGIVHRTISGTITQSQRDTVAGGLLIIWPLFIVEVLWGVVRRDRSQPISTVIRRAALVCLVPPWRMALPDSRTGLIWLPRMGWHPHGKELSERLEHAFAGPMVLVALMILPVLGLEYFRSSDVQSTPELSIALDVGIAVIWVAFAMEFIIKTSAHPKPSSFAMEHWLDLAIVVLPLLEFVLTKGHVGALARLVRAGQALSPAQLARMERLYRLRGVAAEGWHALLLLDFIARMLGHTPEKRIKQIGERIVELENEISELRHDARSLEERLASTQPNQNQPETRSGGATGELPSEAVTATKRPSEP